MEPFKVFHQHLLIMAAYVTTMNWPKRDYVVKSVSTSLCLIYLNKLCIPDVLIDIIKDYLFISAEEVLRRFHRSNLNNSITDMTCDVTYYVDLYGRKRQAHWSTGHDFNYAAEPVQLQQILCLTCGESCTYHTNLDQCCPLEFDGEDGTLVLEEVIQRETAEDDDDQDEDQFDRSDEDNWYRNGAYNSQEDDWGR
jgi:hypothetical protein